MHRRIAPTTGFSATFDGVTLRMMPIFLPE